MKKIIASLAVLALLLTLALPSLAEERSNTLVVTGTATVSLQADTATIELGTQTRGRTVEEAHQENARIMEKVIAKLQEMGITKEDIRTSQYYVYFEQGANQAVPGEPPISDSYSVTNMVFITIKDITKVSAAIDTAAAAGANNVYNLTFQSSKSSEAYNQALRRAVDDARAKALVLAEAAGQTLGDTLNIEATESYGMPYGILNREAYSGAAAPSTPILSGDVSVTANVTLTFGFGIK
jgi:uncharacterized protein YggE